FSPDTLYNLLVGELAVYNRDIETAARNYYREAINTRDPQIAARAAQLARYLRDAHTAMEMAALWHEVDPLNNRAAENLADMYARTNQPLRALSILEQQMQAGEKPGFGILRNSDLPKGSEQLAQVINELERLSGQDRSNNFSLLFTHALLLQKNGNNAEALAQIHNLRRFDGDPVQLAIIEAQLQSELGKHKAAVKVLRKALRKNPDERSLKVAYARKLTQTDLPLAEKIFAELLQETPNDVTLLKSHGLIAAENKHYAAAQNSLHRLLQNNRETSFAQYNLGLIEEARDDKTLALGHYQKVQPGDYYLPATKKIVVLLAGQQQMDQARDYLATLRVNHPQQSPLFWKLEAELNRDTGDMGEALQVLGRAISQHPNNINLRLERSLIAEKLNDLALVEHDLRFVLNLDPDNVIALNALGYVLADRTDRYDEALELIEKAIALKPDDAAIMDSLGWVQFKLGQTTLAQHNLEKAYAEFPDDEIAAHLIELYWSIEEQRSARKIYRSIRKHTDDHPKVDAVMQRLQIRF
ncbi:MAG: tetratricopeptide repeat protein, partial [Gammaproteobacteria bacterium]|nr:tetratricopeptide repeat protein [Gammaproteobacteria bacterium]